MNTVSLSNDGYICISILNLANSLVMIEEGDEEAVDDFLDILNVNQERTSD